MIKYDIEALEYISKLCDGHLRDAITLLDKCLDYSDELTVYNVISALGTIDYDEMLKLTSMYLDKDTKAVLGIVNQIYEGGKDLKQFVKQYISFILDICKLMLGCEWENTQLPLVNSIQQFVTDSSDNDYTELCELLNSLVKLNSEIKYSATPKADLEANIFLLMEAK